MRNIKEIIRLAVIESSMDKVIARLEGEIRDLFAHAVMTVASNDEERKAMKKLFDHIFRDIPAWPKRSK